MGVNPNVQPEKTHLLSGIVTEHAQMYDNLTGMENLIFFASLFGLSDRESRQEALTLLKRLELEEAKDQKLASYSTGMRQRLSLARALIHRPRILFLDEPTAGLDVEGRAALHSELRRLREQGKTLILAAFPELYAILTVAATFLISNIIR